MVKKKFFISASVFVACVFASVCILHEKESLSSDTFIENVEALSQDEKYPGSLEWSCWSQTKFVAGSNTWMCGVPCILVQNAEGTSGTSVCYSINQY